MQEDADAPNDDVVAANLLCAAQYHLVQGVLDALRGQLADSFAHSRLAIEAAAFAAHARRSPEAAELWLRSGERSEAYRDYRRAFVSRDIFPRDDELLADLFTQYDTSAKQTHPSLYRSARHLRFTGADAAGEFHYFQLAPDDESEPARTFLWIVDTHVQLLKVFARVFADVVAVNKSSWEIRVNYVDTRVTLAYFRWEPKIKVTRLRTE